MEIRLLNTKELELAAKTVCDIYEKTIAARASEEEKKQFYEYVNADFFWVEVCKKHLYFWGAFDSQGLCAVSAMQNVGHITLLYTMPQFQKKGIGCALLNEMRRFALESLRLEFVTVNAMPAYTADFFEKNGFAQKQGVIQQASFVSLECMLNTQQSIQPQQLPLPQQSTQPQQNPQPEQRTQPQQSNQPQQSVQLQRNTQQQSEQPPYKATYYHYEEPVKMRKGINGAYIVIILFAALCLIMLVIALTRYSYIPEERNNGIDRNTDLNWSIETGRRFETDERFEIEPEDEPEYETEECCNGDILPDNLGREIVFLEENIFVEEEIDYEIQMEVLSVHEEIDDGEYDIQVEYPQVVYKDGRDASKINEILRKAACIHADKMYPEIQEQYLLYDEGDFKRLETEVFYEITYMSNDLLCVGFSDHYYLGHWAAEYSDIRTRCLNMQSGELYKIEEILSHDEFFDKCYFGKICELEEGFLTTPAFDQTTASKTLDGGVVENRYNSNFLIGKDVFQINLIYHYGDGNLIMRGWLSTAFSHEEYDAYRTDSEFWKLYSY